MPQRGRGSGVDETDAQFDQSVEISVAGALATT
jgi:hypothetical protein